MNKLSHRIPGPGLAQLIGKPKAEGTEEHHRKRAEAEGQSQETGEKENIHLQRSSTRKELTKLFKNKRTKTKKKTKKKNKTGSPKTKKTKTTEKSEILGSIKRLGAKGDDEIIKRVEQGHHRVNTFLPSSVKATLGLLLTGFLGGVLP